MMRFLLKMLFYFFFLQLHVSKLVVVKREQYEDLNNHLDFSCFYMCGSHFSTRGHCCNLNRCILMTLSCVLQVNMNRDAYMISKTCKKKKKRLVLKFNIKPDSLISSPAQAVYHNVKPASLQQQLEVVHMNSDKAEIFSQTWATTGPELVEKLKHNIFSPKKVGLLSIIIF